MRLSKRLIGQLADAAAKCEAYRQGRLEDEDDESKAFTLMFCEAYCGAVDEKPGWCSDLQISRPTESPSGTEGSSGVEGWVIAVIVVVVVVVVGAGVGVAVYFLVIRKKAKVNGE
jgi:hypothetical protein